MIIVVCGFRGSGKSLFGSIAKKMGFPVLEMSEPVLALMKELGLEVNNESVRNFATDFREKGGKDAVAKLMLPRMRELIRDNGNIVVVGARSIEEVDIFRQFGEVVTVAIVSAEKNRFSRIKERNKTSDPKNILNFKWADEVEAKWGLDRLVESCGVKIQNDGSEREFEESVKRFLAKYK